MNSRLIGRIFLLVASLAAIYLTWMSTQETGVPGCGQGSSCDSVLSSRWSKIAGIPVGALGAGAYILLLVISFLNVGKRILLTACTSVIILAAVWFVVIQAFIIHQYCPWCCAIHALAVIGSLLIWTHFNPRVKRTRITGAKERKVAILLTIALISGIAWWQWQSTEPEEIKIAELPQNGISADSQRLYLYGHSVVVDQDRLPHIGDSPDAAVAVLVSDFTCPYCLALHQKLKMLEKEDPGLLRTVILPGFHDNDARKIHQLMLVLWRANPKLYEQITQYLIEGRLPKDPRAIQHVINKNHPGDWKLDLQAYGRWAATMLGAGNDLMLLNGDVLGTSNLPQLMIGGTILTGNPSMSTLREKAESSGHLKENNLPWVREKIKPSAGWEKPLDQGFKYDHEILDVGRPERGKEFIGVFQFTNTGKDAVTINKVTSSCGCSKAEIIDKTIQPGETGKIQVRIDSRSLEGPFKNTTTVYHSRSNKPHRVRLVADVWSPIAAYPNGFTFGNVLITNSSASITAKLVALEGKPIEVKSVTCDNPAFEASIKSLGEGRQYALTVKTSDKIHLTPGGQYAKVDIAIDNTRHPIFSLPISATFVEAVEISPSSLKLNAENATATKSIIVRCHDKNTSGFEVKKMSLVTETNSQKINIHQTKKGNRTRVEFKITDDQWLLIQKNFTDKTQAHFLIETNHPDFIQLKVPILSSFISTHE